MRKLVALRFPGLAAATLWLLGLAPGISAGAPLSLDECTRMALQHNVAVAQGQQNVESAEADVVSARSAFLPTVTVGGNLTKPKPFVQFVGERPVLFDGTLWSGQANANLRFFDLGNWSGYAQADQARSSARETFLDSQQNVVYQTELRFFEVLKQESLLEVQEEAVRQSGEQLKKTRAMKDLGAATQADVYKAEVDHSNNQLTALRTERDASVARASLAEYIGMDPLQDIELASEELETRAAFDLDLASRRAVEVNPELRAARSRLESSKSGVSAAKSDRYPSLSLFGTANFNDSELRINDENSVWQYGLSLDFTIFDGLRTKSNIRRAESQQLLGRRSLEATERQVLLAVRQAYLDLEIARESISVAQGAVRSSEEDLRFAQERYKIGEGTILDVIDAQVNLTRSKTDLVSSTYDRRLAVSALRNAIGDIPVPEKLE